MILSGSRAANALTATLRQSRLRAVGFCFDTMARSRAASTRSDARLDWDFWISANDRGVVTVAVILPGFSDSRWFREAFPDCVAYGFFPQRHMTLQDTARLVHGAGERIGVRS